MTKITFLLTETLLSFFKQKYILFLEALEAYFFKIPKNLVATAFFFFFCRGRYHRKHRYASVKASNAALVKLTD